MVVEEKTSAWAPLRDKVFRGLWIGVLASNVGTWMQTVGAQWQLVGEPDAATYVSLVQTATMLPVLLLALPSGTLADTFDRRRLLLGVQVGLFVVAGSLTALTVLDLMPPALLLTFTFLLGVGQALTLPTWQAVIPEVVPRDELASASALGAVNTNLARSAGPAVAGLLVAHVGVAAVFGLNALSFVIFAVALLRWRRPPESGTGHAERFGPALRAGGRYVRYSPVVRRILLRVLLFVLPGSVIWGLLPLVAEQELNLGSSGYGVLLAALGVGAVLGALLMPKVRERVAPNTLLVVSGVVYGLALFVVALVANVFVVVPVLVLTGLAWMIQVSRMNASLQLFLPNWVRARGFAIYQVVFAGGQAAGALLWGQVTEAFDLRTAYVAAAVLMLAGTATVAWLPLHSQDGDRSPATWWAEPHLMLEPHLDEGPVLVTATWRVPAENRAAFVAAMQAVRRSRQRTGATRWGLFRDGEQAEEFVEVYQVPTWAEHLRQHEGRLTGSDEREEEKAQALAGGPPSVSHLLPADSPD
ncbi:MFS transporter [Actinoplanes friuliensis]|uniref:Putative MFS transporter n=1 Tax=Actinoplanes friuliensis DSM 7358 TaxID=1246995 RepID=U5W611_9ACTN|nr:MFS transporter [Actinoplanes friuliensis]AGZ44452.1 putative MFS transporter [Actinoplanes friuliensis DSM 7358]